MNLLYPLWSRQIETIVESIFAIRKILMFWD